MKNNKYNWLIFLGLVLLTGPLNTYGQSTEIHFNAYSGLFSFRGDGATSTAWMNIEHMVRPFNITSNPYGNKSAFSYAFEIQGQRITKHKNIFGIGLSYEKLSSKVIIDTVFESGCFIYRLFPARGETSLKNSFITLNPYIGRRFSIGKMGFDVLAGIDLAYCIKSKESGSASIGSEKNITTANNMQKPSIDFRPRFQINAQIDKFGLLAGYSLGLTNFQPKNNPKAYSSFLRIGLSYQLHPPANSKHPFLQNSGEKNFIALLHRKTKF